ncbi:MAG: tRNA1(Val) (adenine(37)-N6)-methyltransferase [Candidatus Binatia bacterium]
MRSCPATRPDESLDTIFQGKLPVLQKKKGYRFSLDAILLARFPEIHGREKICDLGTGNGVIPLILATLYPWVQATGLEIQRSMVRRASRNVELNQLEDRVTVVQGDVRSIKKLFLPGSFTVVICNPPYRRSKSGRINPDQEKRIARHEIKGDLTDFLRAGSYLLTRRGKMTLVYPVGRTLDLLQTMRQEGVEPKRVRLVHSFKGAKATLMLAEGIKGARDELEVMPPLVVYRHAGKYTLEMKTILAGA